MRPLAHLVAVILLIPQLMVFSAALVLGHITGGRTLGSLIGRAFGVVDALLGWGGVAVVALAGAVLAAGFSRQWRPFASALMILLALSTTVWLLVWLVPLSDFWDLVLFAPASLAVVLSASLLRADARGFGRRI